MIVNWAQFTLAPAGPICGLLMIDKTMPIFIRYPMYNPMKIERLELRNSR